MNHTSHKSVTAERQDRNEQSNKITRYNILAKDCDERTNGANEERAVNLEN